MPQVRNDKKFGVKVWIQSQDKDIFRMNCLRNHLSMMFVGEKYLTACLDDLTDEQIDRIIESHLEKYGRLNTKRDRYEPLGIRITDNYWQKLGFFAIRYKTSIAKIATCIFAYSLLSYELNIIHEKFGLNFKEKKRNKINMTYDEFSERVSDK